MRDYELLDTKFSVDALELLVIEKGVCTKEDLERLRKVAELNYSDAKSKFLEKQWSKITLGSFVEYEPMPDSNLTLEVITISPQPFRFLAGKIVKKSGKSGYRRGEIFTIESPFRMTLHGLTGDEIISRH